MRRFLIFSALLFLGIAFLSALTASDRLDRAEKPPSRPPASPPSTTTGVLGQRGAPARVQAQVGDVVTLTVRSEQRADVVELRDLGVDAPAEPGLPAEFELIADRPGRFPVVSQIDGRQLGVLLVTSSAPERRARE